MVGLYSIHLIALTLRDVAYVAKYPFRGMNDGAVAFPSSGPESLHWLTKDEKISFTAAATTI